LARLQDQATQAIVWRDAICNWIYHLSGIADDQKRVGKPASQSSGEVQPQR
jgi:alpha-glucuronidase